MTTVAPADPLAALRARLHATAVIEADDLAGVDITDPDTLYDWNREDDL